MRKARKEYGPPQGRMTSEEMQYQFFDTGWFDQADRPKTALAMQHLIEQVPDDVFDELSVTVFAPSPDNFGRVHPGKIASKSFIYLASIIEKKSQQEVDFIVAHEFAHAHLEHEQSARNADTIEDEADGLAVKWGFILPLRRVITNRNNKVLCALKSEPMTLTELATSIPPSDEIRRKESLSFVG